MRRQNSERHVFLEFYGNVSILVLSGYVCHRCLYKMSVTAIGEKRLQTFCRLCSVVLCHRAVMTAYFILSSSADISSCSSLAFFAATSAKSVPPEA